MAQIKSRNQRLSNKGDYAFLQIHDMEGRRLRIIFAMNFDGESVSLYTDRRFFDGNSAGLEHSHIAEFPFLSQYRYGWLLDADWTIERIAADMCGSNSVARYEIGGVLISDIPIDANIEEINQVPCYELDFDIVAPINTDESVCDYISERYTESTRYSGFGGYHSHHGCRFNTAKRGASKYQVGIELEVEFSERYHRDDFVAKDSNWFYCESDGSLGSNGCEIITIPLHPQDATDIEMWNPLINSIKDVAESWSTDRCGLHVHVSRTILGNTADLQTENLGKLLYLYHHYLKDTRVNIDIYGRSRGYNENDGKTKYGDAVSTIGKAILKDKSIKDKLSDEMRSKARTTRYFDINVQNSATIEFRKGRGSINSKRIVSVIEWCLLMCEYVKITPWQQIDYQDFVSWVKIAVKGEKLKSMIEANA
jgi:hypothetical protein